MDDDKALIERNLAVLADCGEELRIGLFERFFAAFPDRQATFLNADAASHRMTDETLQMMHGLAGGESWVWPLVAELVFTHRSFGDLPWAEYEAWLEMTVDEVLRLTGEDREGPTANAWRRQAKTLEATILRARTEWEEAMPKRGLLKQL